MMKDKPAFPRSAFSLREEGTLLKTELYEGMTLREWYAGMALQGVFLSNRYGEPEDAAEYAFQIADAMISQTNDS